MQQSNKQCNYSSQKTFQKMFNIDALGTLCEGPERTLRVTLRDIPTYGLFYLIRLIWLILIKVKWVKRVKEVKRSYGMILSKKNGLVTTFTISWLRCCDKDCALCDNFLTHFGGNFPEICQKFAAPDNIGFPAFDAKVHSQIRDKQAMKIWDFIYSCQHVIVSIHAL